MESNFFIVPGHKVISMGIPKCGQTSIKRAFLGDKVENVHDKSHFEYLDNTRLREIIQALSKEGYTSFTFVRNPYDRVMSFWTQKVRVVNKFTNKTSLFYPGMGFKETVETICRIPDHMSNIHFRSQVSFIKLGNYLPDFIGRLETFEQDWMEMGELLGIDLPKLPWENKTDSALHTGEWTPLLREMVYERYKLDFETLGYDK